VHPEHIAECAHVSAFVLFLYSKVEIFGMSALQGDKALQSRATTARNDLIAATARNDLIAATARNDLIATLHIFRS
jgi:hypothetical protein